MASSYIKGKKNFYGNNGLAFVANDVFVGDGRKKTDALMPELGYHVMRCGRYGVVVSRDSSQVIVGLMYTAQDFDTLLVSERFFELSKRDRQSQLNNMRSIEKLTQHPMREELLNEIALEEEFWETAEPIEIE